ncbi:Nuclear transcription factor Y subunit B-4 [Hibiscus syriacus]|uniref:Nuclear transcription factor Y subunit B-4 n=1 Tax=Hibiscus syriacus TaxID=106335 RepID=A0A6A2YXV3_HIBSY|nr:nuclear transcription factor Y subunit B-4-like [Hibiscus syriacus]KAE8684107.1 Nuclear transcription factor Y subunit B-4 [Hibiscus syriacus]
MGEEQNRLLPIANVGRIMKQILPPSAKLSTEAKQRMQECATEFISFVTSEASDKCRKENRKTMNGDDVCRALSALGLDNYAEAIVRYLHKYREAERERVIASRNNQTNSYEDKDIEESDQNGQPSRQADETQTPLMNMSI